MRVAIILGALALVLAGHAPRVEAQGRTTLQPDRLPGMCLTIAGSQGSVSMPCDGTERQFFVLPTKEGGTLMQGDKCIAPRGTGYYPPLFAEICDGSPAQAWTMNEEGELRSKEGRCISLLGASSRTGGMIFGAECPREGAAHQWKAKYVDFTNVVEGSWESRARPGMCIGYDTHFGIFPCTDQFRQVISFDEKALGQFRIMSSCIAGGYAFGGLAISACYDQPDQMWMKLDGDRLVNRRVQCIEVRNEDGRDVLRTAPCGKALEQQWVFRPAPQQ